LMLKEETPRFAGESRATEEIPIVAAGVESESRALNPQGLAARGAFANAKSQRHIQPRAPKYRLLAELDRGR